MEVKLFLKLLILFIKNKFINLNEKLNLESVLLPGALDHASCNVNRADGATPKTQSYFYLNHIKSRIPCLHF